MTVNYIIAVYSGLILTNVISRIDASTSNPSMYTGTSYVNGYAPPNRGYESLQSYPINSQASQPLAQSKLPVQDKLPSAGIPNTLSYNSLQPNPSLTYGDMSNYYHPFQSSQGKVNDQFISSYAGTTPTFYLGQSGINGITNPYTPDWRSQATQQIVPSGSFYQQPHNYEQGRTVTGGEPSVVTTSVYGNPPSIPMNQNLYGSQSYASGKLTSVNELLPDNTYTKITTPPRVIDAINIDSSKTLPPVANLKYQEIPIPNTGTLQTHINVPSDQKINYSKLPYPSATQSDRPLQVVASNQNIVTDRPLQSAGSNQQNIVSGFSTAGYTPYKKPEKLTMEDLFSYTSFGIGNQLSTTSFVNKNPMRFKLMTSIISSLVDIPLPLVRSIMSTVNKHLPDSSVHDRLILGLATANTVYEGVQYYMEILQKYSSQNRKKRSITPDDSPEYMNLESLPALPERFSKYVKDKIAERISNTIEVDSTTQEKFIQDILNDLRYGLAPQFEQLRKYYQVN